MNATRCMAVVAGLALLGVAGLARSQSAADAFDPDLNGQVRVIELQTDGQLLVGGQFTTVGGQSRTRIVRLLNDGNADPAFSPTVTGNTSASVWAIHQQPSTVPGLGRILIGGNFSQVNGQPRANLARLNANGTLESSFNVAVDDDVRSFDSTMSPDGIGGTIFIGGRFTSVQGQPRSRVAAILADGTLLATFNPTAITGGQVNVVRLQRDHAGSQYGLLVAGSFSTGAGTATIRRFSVATGALDAGFMVTTSGGTTFGNFVSDLVVQPDGRVLIAGDFDTVNGQPRSMIARLNIDGSVDESFVPPALNAAVMSVDLQPDGRVLIGGAFTGLSLRNRIARLNADGSLDTRYAALISPDQVVNAVRVQSDGAATFGGQFDTVTGLPRQRLARLDPNGVLDQTLAISGATDGVVRAIALQDDGKILVGGLFTEFNGAVRHRLARLVGANGIVDAGFSPDFNSHVHSIAVLPDRRILVGGSFSTINGITRRRLALLRPDGTVDTSFNAQISDGFVASIVPQADGRFLIGGSFTQVAGATRQSVARLLATGELDTSFHPPHSNGLVRAIAVQADGRVVIGGEFTLLGGGWARSRLARLHANGTFDGSFNSSAGSNDTIRAITQGADGSLIVAGDFTQMSGSARQRIAALNADGGLLATFASGANGMIWSVVPRIDGSFYVAGDFTSIAGQARGRVARLSSTGAALAGFDGQADHLVRAMVVQPDGKVLIGGSFQMAGNAPRNGLARLSTPASVRHTITWNPVSRHVLWQWQGPASDPLYAPQLLVSTECCDTDSFIAVPDGSAMTGGAMGTQRVYALSDFHGLNGTFYLRTATITGEARGVSTFTQYSPVWRFEGAGPDDTIFADGFELSP